MLRLYFSSDLELLIDKTLKLTNEKVYFISTDYIEEEDEQEFAYMMKYSWTNVMLLFTIRFFSLKEYVSDFHEIFCIFLQ